MRRSARVVCQRWKGESRESKEKAETKRIGRMVNISRNDTKQTIIDPDREESQLAINDA
jgi:hypothetical protein